MLSEYYGRKEGRKVGKEGRRESQRGQGKERERGRNVLLIQKAFLPFHFWLTSLGRPNAKPTNLKNSCSTQRRALISKALPLWGYTAAKYCCSIVQMSKTDVISWKETSLLWVSVNGSPGGVKAFSLFMEDFFMLFSLFFVEHWVGAALSVSSQKMLTD